MSAFAVRAVGCAVAAVALALTGLASSRPASPEPTPDPGAAVVVFDSPADQRAKSYIHALFLENLLTHFHMRADLVPLAAYQPGQLARYSAGFFVGTTPGAQIAPTLLADIRASSRPFTWMGLHIGQLLDSAEARRRFGFSFREFRGDLGYHSVHYKQAVLSKTEAGLNLVSIEDPRSVEVLATVADRRAATSPYALKSGRFWYFASSPFSYLTESSHYLALCDLLHDILGIDHPPDSRALVRIEDVSVDDDPEDLTQIADLLAARHVPFQISFIPVFLDPARGLEVHLGDRRDIVDALHYMVQRGGTPVMHGVTHQVHGLSGDEYEFWDEMSDRPVAGDSDEFITRRLRQGLSECFEIGIFPVAFETPHYGASETDYRAISRVFSASYDRPMVAPDQTSTQLVPFPVVDRYGRYIIPENLGYFPQERPDPAAIVRHALNLRVVRDGIASFYFHPFLNRALLEEAVRGISDLGYRFVSIREFASSVNFDRRFLVRTQSGSVTVSPQDEYWRLRLFNAEGRLVETEISPGRQSGPTEVVVAVPPRGWAAIDCLRNPPQNASVQRSWLARFQGWWRGLAQGSRTASLPASRSAWLLWRNDARGPESHNQESYRRVLELTGYQVKRVPTLDFTHAPADTATLLVVPEAAGAGLSPAQRRESIRYLKRGGAVVADGHQAWLGEIGFEFPGRRTLVSTVEDPAHPEVALLWRPDAELDRVRPPDGARELMLDNATGRPLAVSGSYGDGRYVYLAAPLDSYTDEGTSRYPYFPEYLRDTFGPATPLRSHRMEAYFDPSYRPGADLNRLATLWRKSGIKTIYAAAWISSRTYSFPYQEFIRACHRNGVSVYAWLILPAVTPRMWDDHPEWREKAASGVDGRVGWRYSMNLQNPACFHAAMDWMDTLLRDYDWDGVNVSELNFDADWKDRLRPDRYVPMNIDVRAGFRKISGFDPIALFQPQSRYYYKKNPAALAAFERYREDIVTDWHRRVLAEIEPIRRERGWEVIVTALDSLHDAFVRPALGVDSRRIAALMREFPFTLQVEDPVQFWHESPDRYLRFAETYRPLVPDASRLMFDVNVVDGRDINSTFLPSKRAIGTELARTVASAAAVTGRVAIYSESSVAATDWELLRTALTGSATATAGRHGWQVRSPLSLVLTPASAPAYAVDGREWPVTAAEGLLLPPGSHFVSSEESWQKYLDSSIISARVVGTTADLLEARSDSTGLVLRYRSPGRAVMMVDQKPQRFLVDGRPAALHMEPGDHAWSVIFPAGEHCVSVITDTPAGTAVHFWSWALASSISIFGLFCTALMLAIYLQLRWKRGWR